MILLEFGGQVLAFDEQVFEAARLRGLELMADRRSQVEDEILDAAGMERRTGVPATWWAESARRGAVPSLQLGKYVRFSLREALEAAKGKRRSGQ